MPMDMPKVTAKVRCRAIGEADIEAVAELLDIPIILLVKEVLRIMITTEAEAAEVEAAEPLEMVKKETPLGDGN